MAKKLSPLVIPTVVDTSGITKGVRDINSRLRGVGGRAGGFGGGGGFGQNLIGVGGSSIGGIGAAAMGAAFGATAGARLNSFQAKVQELKEGAKGDKRKLSSIDRAVTMMNNNTSRSFGNRAVQHQMTLDKINAKIKQSKGLEQGLRSQMELSAPGYGGTSAQYAQRGAEYATLRGLEENRKRLQKEANIVRRQRNTQMFMSRMTGKIGRIGAAFGGLGNVNPMGLFAAGAPAGMALGVMNNFAQDMQSRFSNINNLTGANFEVARNLQMTYQNQNKATTGQSFWMGARQRRANVAGTPSDTSRVSNTEAFLSAMGGGLAQTAGYVGQGIEMGVTAGVDYIGKPLARMFFGYSKEQEAIAEAMASAFKRNSI